MVDNFDFVREKVLKFEKPGDFYVVHVLSRVKDLRSMGTEWVPGSHEDGARLIKTWYVNSLDYWDVKKETIKETAHTNKARVYILPQVRNTLVINRVLAKAIIDQIDESAIRYDHLLRTAICGCHRSDHKKWILDLDNDLSSNGSWFEVYSIASKIKEKIVEWMNTIPERRNGTCEIYPTRSGWGILVDPFDVRIAKDFPDPVGKIELDNYLKKDGMLLTFCDF